jgi:hypothetical protein
MSSSASVDKDFFSICVNVLRRELLPDQRHDQTLSIGADQPLATVNIIRILPDHSDAPSEHVIVSRRLEIVRATKVRIKIPKNWNRSGLIRSDSISDPSKKEADTSWL